MPGYKEIAISGYYYATLPWRAHRCAQLVQDRRAPLCVLFYHRVADRHPNAWTMSSQQFGRQMEWLRHHVELVSLAEIQRRMAAGDSDRVAVSITFDDGYAENCDAALPLLIEQQIPCTYFVSLDFVLSRRPFPHDVQAGRPLEPNTVEQLRDLAEAGVEIGSHTRHHRDLGQVRDTMELRDELLVATDELSQLVGHPVRYFAFPYGRPENLNAAAVRLAADAGLQGVCSAYGAYNLPGDDPFHIQRIHGDPEFVRFKNWLTVDPRKLSIGRSFEMPEVPWTPTTNV